MSLASYRQIHPDPTTYTGTPTHYVPIGRVGVAVQPSDASEIVVDSTDEDVCVAYLEGYVEGGYLRKHAVTMTGTAAASFGATEFIELHDFYLSKPALGTVTLHEDEEELGATLAQITIGQTRPNYYGFYLWPTPAAAVDYYIDARREVDPMTANTSEPPWPTDFHHLLVAYGAWREWVHKGDLNRAAEAKTRYDKVLSRLKYATQVQTDALPVMGRGRPVGHSRLGGNFPADTWSWG
jgi:hypothetical protein